MEKEKKESCKDCRDYKKVDGKKFKCLMNYITYTSDKACFCFRRKDQ